MKREPYQIETENPLEATEIRELFSSLKGVDSSTARNAFAQLSKTREIVIVQYRNQDTISIVPLKRLAELLLAEKRLKEIKSSS